MGGKGSGRRGVPVKDRFWNRVEKTDTCWNWTGHLNSGGYGLLSIGKERVGAHRLSFEWHIRLLNEGECVLHRCDNRRCVNPAHLFAGSYQDNAIDASIKERMSKKLTRQDARDIRQSPLSSRELAPHYGVSDGTIRRIRRGEFWKEYGQEERP